jgi:hypothetical protein
MLEEPFEEPEWKGDEKLPRPELKPLPKELKYRFLDDTNRYPAIIISNWQVKKKNLWLYSRSSVKPLDIPWMTWKGLVHP